MKIDNPLSNWVVNKILRYIVTKEGCILKDSPITKSETIIAEFYDSFGYKYQLELTCKGRVQDLP